MKIMRFIHVHIFFDSYFYSASGFMTLWACICIALVFPQQADSSPAFEDGDLFLTEPQPDINNNFFLDDGSGSSDFSSLSIEPQPVLDDVALTSALTDQVSLADTSDDECSMNYVLPSSSSKSRLRARLTTDSCNNPDVTIEGVEGGKNPTMTAEEIKKRWCGGTNVPILEFGNVPVCQERGQGVFSEYLLPETELSSGYFQTLFRGTMITPLLPDACQPNKVWCCNTFIEDFEHTRPFYQEPMGPSGTGYWCVKSSA